MGKLISFRYVGSLLLSNHPGTGLQRKSNKYDTYKQKCIKNA